MPNKDEDRVGFHTWLDKSLALQAPYYPAEEILTFDEKEELPIVNKIYKVRPSALPYTSSATTKPAPFRTIVEKIAAECDKDGFQTADEPLRVHMMGVTPKKMAYIKGMARTSVVLAVLRFAQLNEWKLEDYLPQLCSSMYFISGACLFLSLVRLFISWHGGGAWGVGAKGRDGITKRGIKVTSVFNEKSSLFITEFDFRI